MMRDYSLASQPGRYACDYSLMQASANLQCVITHPGCGENDSRIREQRTFHNLRNKILDYKNY